MGGMDWRGSEGSVVTFVKVHLLIVTTADGPACSKSAEVGTIVSRIIEQEKDSEDDKEPNSTSVGREKKEL